MSKEVAEWSPQDERKQYLQMVADAAANPNVDVAKMEALLAMQERIMDREARGAFVRAFTEMQALMPHIDKKGAIKNNSGQVQSRYSKWEDIYREVQPLLGQFGFSLSFRTGSDPAKGVLTVNAVLQHKDGHSEESGPMPLPTDASGAKNNVQGIGSSMSYGKRYTTIALLNIVTVDDTDGKAEAPATGMAEDAFKVLLADAEAEAQKGVAAYAEFFKRQPRANKLALTADRDNEGSAHDNLKAKAEKADKPRPAVAPNFDNMGGR